MNECSETFWVGDAIFLCRLEEGHPGPHVESGKYKGVDYAISWMENKSAFGVTKVHHLNAANKVITN